MKEASRKRPHIVSFSLYETSRIGKSTETEGRFVIARGQERGKWGVSANECRVSLWGDKNVLKLGVTVVALNEYTL